MSRKTRRGVKLAVVFLVTLTSFTIAISSLLFVSKLNLQSSKPFAIISEGASEQVAFGGSFSPSYGIKRSVFLQAKDKQGWSTVARSTLDQSGKFNFSIDTTEGITSYRATVGKTPFRQSSPELNIATCNAPGSTRTSTSSTIVVLEVTGDFPANASQPKVTVEMPNSTEKIHSSKVYRNAAPGLWTVSATAVSAGLPQYWPIKSWQDVNVPKNKCTVIEVNYILKVPTETIVITPEQAGLIHENPDYQN